MALSCPNKSLPEWKRLVDEVGEREALNDYFQFGTIRSPYAVKDKLERLNIANYTNKNFKIGERYFKPTVESLIDVEKNSSVVDAMVTHFGYRGSQSEEDLIKRKFTQLYQYHKDIEGFKKFVTQPTTQSVKPGVSELFESNPKLANIGTPEQYSQYLDTVFPDSKVKNIVYHGSSYGKKENFNSNTDLPYGDRHRVIFFATSINQALAFSDYDKSKITSALININNPFDYNSFSDELRQDLIKEEYNRIIETLGSGEIEYANKESKKFPDIFKTKIWDLFTGRKFLSKIYQKYNIDSWFEVQGNIEGRPYENIAVFEPKQIHILSSKKDLEMFKEFVTTRNIINTYGINITNEDDIRPVETNINNEEKSLKLALKGLTPEEKISFCNHFGITMTEENGTKC